MCMEQSENVCGYIVNEGKMIVEAYFSICIYKNHEGRYDLKRVGKEKYGDPDTGHPRDHTWRKHLLCQVSFLL
jgi:hypothetical protein